MTLALFRRLAFIFAVGLCALVSARCSAQTLQELRSDVRESNPPPAGDSTPSKSSGDNASNDYDYDDEYDSDDSWPFEGIAIVGIVIGAVITAPFWGPPVLIGDTYMEAGYFAHHPHQYDQGYMLIGPSEAAGLPGPRQPRSWAARVRSEFGTDFDDIQWIGGHVLIETRPRIGIESDFRHVREKLRPGTRDSLWVGDGNFLYRFAQSPCLVMRTGLGFNFLSDTRRTDFGVNFTYGGDFFPLRPWVISGELDLGTLGHTHVYHFRGTLGANWNCAEAFVGYDYYDIGPSQIAGLATGLRMWF